MNNLRDEEEDRRDVHFLDYWRTIWRGRWTVLTVFIIIVTLVGIGTFTQKSVYRARVTVEITPQSRKVAPVADVAELGSGGFGWFEAERYFNSQYEIIRSRDVAIRVFDQLDLYNHPRFEGSIDPIGALAGMINVTPIKDTGIVEIALEGHNPEEVASWVNTIAQIYVKRNLDQAIEATTNAVAALADEIATIRQRLEDTQTATFELAERDNFYVPANQQKTTDERLSSLQEDLTQSQVRKVAIESALRQVEDAQGAGISYENISVISNDPVIQQLYNEKVDLEQEYERLLVTFRAKHSRVLEKKTQIDKINDRIDSEAGRIIATLKAEFDLLKERESRVLAAINEARAESITLNRRASSYELAVGEAEETRRIYDLISARVKEIDLSQSLLSNNLRILDEAPVPNVPIKPRTMLNMAVGILIGLLLGVGVVFFLDYLDNTIRSADDVEQFLRLTLLAIIPKENPGTEKAVKEAYQSLRTNLLFSRRSKTGNALLVTSAGPQEGKSRTITSLARTFASAGERVVLVDCDMRRPTLHQKLSLDRERGITNYILSSDGEDWRTYVKPTEAPNLFAITCGPIPPNPPDVFGHDRFKELLATLRQNFDWVFIDSPPVISLTDSMILATMADMIAFIVKHNENDKDLIRRCVRDLRKVNQNVVGAVLNHVDLDRSHYKDYYYMGYYYYGESADKKTKKRRDAAARKSLLDADLPDRTASRSVG
jgi:capsular exopolysaccharide synthesis family protein